MSKEISLKQSVFFTCFAPTLLSRYGREGGKAMRWLDG